MDGQQLQAHDLSGIAISNALRLTHWMTAQCSSCCQEGVLRLGSAKLKRSYNCNREPQAIEEKLRVPTSLSSRYVPQVPAALALKPFDAIRRRPTAKVRWSALALTRSRSIRELSWLWSIETNQNCDSLWASNVCPANLLELRYRTRLTALASQGIEENSGFESTD